MSRRRSYLWKPSVFRGLQRDTNPTGVIRLENICKSYSIGKNSLQVLKKVDVTIEDGEFVAIMGSSGSGKSTLLNILGILDDYDEGTYHLDETLIRNLSERKAAEYRNRFIGFVFQSFNLLHFKTAAENVALPLYYQKVPRKKRMEEARLLLDKVGLGDRTEHLPSELSGGQMQRVALARALISKPRLILADEPTGALDSKTSHDLMQMLRGVNDEGITIVLVTHEVDIANKANRTIFLRDGVVVDGL